MGYLFQNVEFISWICRYSHIEIEGKIKFIKGKGETIIFTELCQE